MIPSRQSKRVVVTVFVANEETRSYYSMDITEAIISSFQNKTTEQIKAKIKLNTELEINESVAIISKYYSNMMYCYGLLVRKDENHYAFDFYHVARGEEYFLHRIDMQTSPKSFAIIHEKDTVDFIIELQDKTVHENINYTNATGGRYGYWESDDSINSSFVLSEPKHKNWSVTPSSHSSIGKLEDNKYLFITDKTSDDNAVLNISLDNDKPYIAIADSPDGKDKFWRGEINENLVLDSNNTVEKDLSKGIKYTLSEPMSEMTYTVVIKGEVGGEKKRFRLYNQGVITDTKDLGDGLFQATFTGKVDVDDLTYLAIYSMPQDAEGTSKIDWIKVEKGDQATPYYPSPKDGQENSQPSYVGYSLVDSENPENYTWVKKEDDDYQETFQEDVYTVQFQSNGLELSSELETDMKNSHQLVTDTQGEKINYIYYPKKKVSRAKLHLALNEEGESVLENVQITKGNEEQSYLPTSSETNHLSSSELKIPSKNVLDDNENTIYLRFYKSKHANDEESTLLLSGDFSIHYEKEKVILKDKNKEELAVELVENLTDKLDIIWSWENGEHKLAINTNSLWIEEFQEMEGNTGITELLPSQSYNFEANRILITDEGIVYSIIVEQEIEKILRDVTQKKIDITFTENVVYRKNNFIEGTMAPRDGSPILVSDSQGQMNRHYFFDEYTGDYVPYNKEYFTYKGEDFLPLAYDNIDKNFHVTVETDEGEFIGEPTKVEGKQLYLQLTEYQKAQLFGEELTVTYQVDRSYSVEFNTDTALDSYKVNFAKSPQEALTVTQEGNRFSDKKLAKEVELNPILNPQHKGFLYITQNDQEANGFRMNISSDMVHADGIDSADVIIEAIDAEGNEILNPFVDIYIVDEKGRTGNELGEIVPVVTLETLKERKMAGRVYLKYYAPYIEAVEGRKTKKIYIVAYDRDNNIGIQYPLYIKPTDSPIIQRGKIPDTNSLIVFEYLARYYRESHIPEKILSIIDFDGNDQVTIDDLNTFIQKQYQYTEMRELSNRLLTLEGDE